MSFTEPTADEGQPEGQAEVGTQPYAEYLNRVPEEVRGDIEPVFKDWNSSVNKRFEEHASFRKEWEPYETAGIRQHDPSVVGNALQLYQLAANSPQEFQQWFEQYAGERGLTLAQAAKEVEQDFQTFDQYDPQAQMQQLLEQKLSPLEKQIESFMQRQQQLEQQSHQAAIQEQINQEIARIKDEHGKELPKKVLEQFDDLIDRFGSKYASSPGATPAFVVESAWKEIQSLANQFSTAALQSKVDQPEPSLTGDVADGSNPQIKSLKEANKLATQQIRETIRNGGTL